MKYQLRAKIVRLNVPPFWLWPHKIFTIFILFHSCLSICFTYVQTLNFVKLAVVWNKFVLQSYRHKYKSTEMIHMHIESRFCKTRLFVIWNMFFSSTGVVCIHVWRIYFVTDMIYWSRHHHHIHILSSILFMWRHIKVIFLS
jgi:hypothetical protein